MNEKKEEIKNGRKGRRKKRRREGRKAGLYLEKVSQAELKERAERRECVYLAEKTSSSILQF